MANPLFSRFLRRTLLQIAIMGLAICLTYGVGLLPAPYRHTFDLFPHFIATLSALYWLGWWIFGQGYLVKAMRACLLLNSPHHLCPWRRFWARIYDIVIWQIVALLILCYLLDRDFFDLSVRESFKFFCIGAVYSYYLIEPFMLASWGTTPIKYCLGIRVRNAAGEKPSLREAFRRSWGVLWRGQAFFIPVALFIASFMARRTLIKYGSTPWDTATQLTVTCKPIGWLRQAPFLIIPVAFLLPLLVKLFFLAFFYFQIGVFELLDFISSIMH